MVMFDEYYDIEKFPQGFLEEIGRLKELFSTRYPDSGHEIQIVKNEWPRKNVIRLKYGNLTLTQISEIDTELHRLFQKHGIDFEVTSSGFGAAEE